jgi:hypothetical protein
MYLIPVIVTISVLGFLIWAILTYVPMPPVFQKLLVGVVALVLVLWLLQVFGLLGSMHTIRVGA